MQRLSLLARYSCAQLPATTIPGCAFWVALVTASFPALSLAGNPQPAPEAPAPVVRIAFVGDILLEASWQQQPLPPSQMFEGVRAFLAEFDLVVGNLEEPLTNWPTRTPHKNPAMVAAGRDFIF